MSEGVRHTAGAQRGRDHAVAHEAEHPASQSIKADDGKSANIGHGGRLVG